MFDWNEPQHLDDVRSAITLAWIEHHVDPAAAVRTDRNPVFTPLSNQTTEPWAWQMEATPGMWRCDPWGNLYVLMRHYIQEALPTETPSEWDSMVKFNPTVAVYIDWARAHHVPPPTTVIENITMGWYQSTNLRRWLAARAVGHETLWTWFSPTDTHGRALWLKPSWGTYWQGEMERHRENGWPLDRFDDYVLADFGLGVRS